MITKEKQTGKIASMTTPTNWTRLSFSPEPSSTHIAEAVKVFTSINGWATEYFFANWTFQNLFQLGQSVIWPDVGFVRSVLL